MRLTTCALPPADPDAAPPPRVHAAEAAAVLALTAFAAWIRFHRLGALSESGDEGFTYLAVRGVLHGGIPRLPSGAVYWKSLLYTYLATATTLCTGIASPAVDAALRWPAALASTLLVPALWWTGRRTFSPAAGLAAAALISVHVWQVEMSHYARYYPVLELALVLLVERFHAVHFRGQRAARRGLILAFAAALATSTIALTMVLLYAPLLALRRTRLLADRGLWWELGAIGSLSAAWLAFESRWEVGFVRRPRGGAFGAVEALTTSLGHWSSQFFRWLPVLVPAVGATAAIAAVAWCGLALVPAVRRAPSSGGAFAFVLGAATVLSIAVLGFGAAHAVPRYLFHLLPFGIVLATGCAAGAAAAIGAMAAGDRGFRLGSWIGAALALGVGLIEAAPLQSWRIAERTHADRVEDGRYLPSIEVLFTWDTAGTGRYVAEHLAAGDRVLGTHPIYTYVYTGHLDGWLWHGNRDLWDAYHEGPDGRLVDNYIGAPVLPRLADLAAVLAAPGRVWIVTTPSVNEAVHVDPGIRRFLAQHGEARVFEGRDGVSAVYRFEGGASP